MIHIVYGLLIFVHVIACIGLIAVILLQAGRGGGLSEAFGGMTQNIFGSKSNEILVKATSAFAIVFLCSSLLLGILTSKRGRSLLNTKEILKQINATQTQDQSIPVIPQKPVTAVTEKPESLLKNEAAKVVDVEGADAAQKE